MNFTTDNGDYTDFTIPLLLKNLQEKVHRCDIIYELWSIILEMFEGQVPLPQEELPQEFSNLYTIKAMLLDGQILSERFRADIDRDAENIDKLFELEQKMNRNTLNQYDEKEIAVLLTLEKKYKEIELAFIREMKRELTGMINTLTPEMKRKLTKQIELTPEMEHELSEITELLTLKEESK